MIKVCLMLVLGLVLSTTARAADDQRVIICLRTGGIPSICEMTYKGDDQALKIANSVLDRCEAIREPTMGDPSAGPEWQCAVERDYIRARWGN